MRKKPNAAQITHGLAQLGGGSKKEGGGGMLAGLANSVEKAFLMGNKYGLEGIDVKEMGQNILESDIKKTNKLPNKKGKRV